jgi:NADPH2:quinone reductase
VPPVDLGILAGKGSLFVTRPTLNTYTASREDLLTASGELFDVVQKGAVKLSINQTYALRDAAQAHRDLQDRKTTGSTVFTVYGKRWIRCSSRRRTPNCSSIP